MQEVAGATADRIRYFKSHEALKRALKPAGKNRAWHNIVEQHDENVAKFGSEAIHNTDNVVNIPSGFKGSLHGMVTGHYNSTMPGTNMRVRDTLRRSVMMNNTITGLKF